MIKWYTFCKVSGCYSFEFMKREFIKKANELEDQIIKIENQMMIWNKSDSFYGSAGDIQIKESKSVAKHYDVSLKDIPFEKLRGLFLEFYNDQIKNKEKELMQILNTTL